MYGNYGQGALEFIRVRYYYDERGFRSLKIDYDDSYDFNAEVKRTYYVRDAGGKIMAAYEKIPAQNINTVKPDFMVYGQNRIGIYSLANNEGGGYNGYFYELKDHIGNVRATIAKKIVNNEVEADVLSWQHYYPYGMVMPNQNFTGSLGAYRFAFQGQERDREPNTEHEFFQLRTWDGRLGRWTSIDPYYQFQSPYLGMGNNPISGIDPDGGFVGILPSPQLYTELFDLGMFFKKISTSMILKETVVSWSFWDELAYQGGKFMGALARLLSGGGFPVYGSGTYDGGRKAPAVVDAVDFSEFQETMETVTIRRKKMLQEPLDPQDPKTAG